MTYVAAFYHAFAGDQKVQLVIEVFEFEIIKKSRFSAS
jgi:hypothetical protein